jgi:hypothetical protein
MRTAVAVLMGCLTPACAAAQPAPPVRPKNDITVTIGWTGSEFDLSRYDNWREGLLS